MRINVVRPWENGKTATEIGGLRKEGCKKGGGRGGGEGEGCQ